MAELLGEKHEDRTFTYTQLARRGDWAIFCQQHKLSGVERFELVRIRIQKERTWPNGVTTPEREAYPGSSAWGTDGFTYHGRAEAEAALVEKLAPAAVTQED